MSIYKRKIAVKDYISNTEILSALLISLWGGVWLYSTKQ